MAMTIAHWRAASYKGVGGRVPLRLDPVGATGCIVMESRRT